MKTTDKHIDFAAYDVPPEWRQADRIFKIYPPLAGIRHTGFDIFDFEKIFNDPKTKELISSGNTIGCFYIESPGMRSLLRRLNVHTFDMLVAASSIIRPGVAESGMMQEFILRHNDPSRRKYIVPQMEEVLGDTYGVMIYQEDVMKVAHKIGGLTLEEADLLRRAMSGKMRSHNAMSLLYDKFTASCKLQGIGLNASAELWRQIESFAGYSFCKAHSASFALLSFQVAFLKAHYPAEFMTCVLNNGGGFYSPAVYIWECRRLGLKIDLPCINKSMNEYVGKGNNIRMGLMAIKNISGVLIQKILDERKRNGEFKSLEDFIIRVKPGYKEAALLIKCGAMGCFKKNRNILLRLLDVYMKRMLLLEKDYSDLFIEDAVAFAEQLQVPGNCSAAEICRAEYNAFDFMITRHPLYFYEKYVNSPEVVKARDMRKYAGKNVKMIGWYMTSKRIRTRKGDIMKFLSLEDRTGTFEAVIFPKVYEQFADKTMSMGPYVIEGYIDQNDERNLVVRSIEVLSAEALSVKESNKKDSSEYKYYGETENVTLDELEMVETLGREKLLNAYAKAG